VQYHLVQAIECLEGFRRLLQAVLSTNATLVAQQQNEEMKVLTEAALAQNEEVKKISVGGHPVRPDTDRHRVRHELRLHDRAVLDLRLSVRAAADGAGLLVLYWMFRRRDWL
jgi:hypothetical protein